MRGDDSIGVRSDPQAYGLSQVLELVDVTAKRLESRLVDQHSTGDEVSSQRAWTERWSKTDTGQGRQSRGSHHLHVR